MAVTFACEICHAEYTVADSLAGKKGRCNACGHLMQVPAAPARAPAARAPAAAAPPPRGSSPSTAAARTINFADPLDSDSHDIPARYPAKPAAKPPLPRQSDADNPLAALESIADDDDDGTIPFTEEFHSRPAINLNLGGATATVCIMLGVVACLLPLLNQPIINAYGRLPVYTGLALGLFGAFILVHKGSGVAGVAAGAITVAAFFAGVLYKPLAHSDQPIVQATSPRAGTSSAAPRPSGTTPIDPALRANLQNLNSFDPATRLAAAQQILQSPPPDRLADIARAMEPKLVEEDPRLRLLAIQGVMLQPTTHTPSILAHLVRDPSRAVRESALRALGALGGPAALSAIASRLADDPAVAREALADAQAGDPRVAIDTFRQILTDARDARLRAIAIDELAARNVRDESFLPLIDDPTPAVRDAAIRALGKLKVAEAIRPLAARLGHSDEAVAALQSFGPAAETEALRCAESHNKLVRAAAAQVLLTAATPASLPTLQRLARDEHRPVADAALAAWKRLVPDDFSPLRLALRDLDSPDPLRQRAALDGLARLEPDANRSKVAVALLPVALGDNVDLRLPAARALQVWRTRDAVILLVAALGDHDILKRERAKEVLGHLKDPAAIDPICDLAESGNTTAVEVLAAMGPIAEDGALRLLNCNDPQVQLAAVRALAEIGTNRSILPLRALARSRPSNAARAEDIAALNKISERIAAQTREENRRRIKTVPTTAPPD